MQRYVVVDADGFVENVILWDGVSSYTIGGGCHLELESETSASARQVDDLDQESEK